MAELTVFSEVLAASRDLLDSGKPVLITAEARMDGGGVRLNAQKIQDLDLAAANRTEELKIYVETDSCLLRLRDTLDREANGNGKVLIVLGLESEEEVQVELPGKYGVSPAVAAMIKAIPGVSEVVDSVG